MNITPPKIITQILLASVIISAIGLVCFKLQPLFSYRVVAIILLFIVGIFAVTVDIIPVLFAAILSALLLNFFFIPPLYTFHIASTDDALLFIIFLVVALVNAILTSKIRKAHAAARDKQEKEKTIQLYNTLINSLSHELRTPLATIMASVDTLSFQPNNLNAEQKNILLEQINIASNRLNEQVENLLNTSRLESGMLKLKNNWCDVNELISDVLYKVDAITDKQIIFTENENLPLVNIDSGILMQILQNIIHNALQHTPANTTIEINLTLKNENELNIYIKDNGNGVSNDELQKLFEKFYRLPNSAKGGTGLGLSIVKGYVETLNGTVIAKHNTPKGLIFEIILPVETSYINKLKNE